MAVELRIVSVHTGGWVDSEEMVPGRMADAAQRQMGDDLEDLGVLLAQGWTVLTVLGMRDYGDERGKLEVAKLLMQRDAT